jgi:hypothetical protein
MFRKKFKIHSPYISGASAVLMLLLSACNGPTLVAPTPQPETAAPTSAPAVSSPAPTAIPTSRPAAEPTRVQNGPGTSVTVNANGVAQSYAAQMVAAVPASAGGPYWEAMPQYTQLTLTGYPITNHLMQPQIFVYPASDLATANEGAGKVAADLQTLLQNRQAGQKLPFLPLFNASQVMHAQVNYLDFKNGKGVRYLTQFDQGPLPINNHELIYTYQGLTSDGKFYMAAVLPVNLASLPADEKVTGQEPPEFGTDFLKYLDNVAGALNQQPASAFTPDLGRLDALVQSIEIK